MALESDRPYRNQRQQIVVFLYGGMGRQIQPDALDKDHGANDGYHKKRQTFGYTLRPKNQAARTAFIV